MRISNAFINRILITLLVYVDNKEHSGLLIEEIPLSLKRRLQRIRKDLIAKQQELQADFEEVKDKPEELEIFMNEEFELNHDFVSLEMIEAINTKVNYDFEAIEKIAK